MTHTLCFLHDNPALEDEERHKRYGAVVYGVHRAEGRENAPFYQLDVATWKNVQEVVY